MAKRVGVFCWAGVLAGLLWTGTTRAALLNLTYYPPPDIASFYIDMDYSVVACVGTVNATGFALSFDDDGVGPALNINTNYYNFNVSVQTDCSGNVSGGTFEIGGDVLGYGNANPGVPLLLAGNVVAMGYQNGGGDLFNFEIALTGGDLAIPAYYGNPGTHIGIDFDANFPALGGFSGTFAAPWSNNEGNPGSGIGNADTKPIPEPATLTLVLAAGAILRRRARAR